MAKRASSEPPRPPAEYRPTSISFKAAIPVIGKSQAEIDALIETLKASGWSFETGKVYVNKQLFYGDVRGNGFHGYSVEMPAVEIH
jgi:hypothetical protein